MAEKQSPSVGRSSSTLENGYHHFEHSNTSGEMDRKSTYEEHGPGIDHEIPQRDEKPSHPELRWPKIRRYMQGPFGEFWGVFVIIMFGDGSVAQVVLSSGEKGSYQSISWGWG
jgi:aquaglyceroporin related protein, other eukaryote